MWVGSKDQDLGPRPVGPIAVARSWYGSEDESMDASGDLAAALARTPLLCIEAHQSTSDAWQMLVVSGLRHLVVTDEAGSFIAVLTDRDIVSATSLQPSLLLATAICDVASTGATAVVTQDTTASQAAAIMLSKALEALVVTDARQHPIALITESDLLHFFAPA
jgi:CBS domain-containing protein